MLHEFGSWWLARTAELLAHLIRTENDAPPDGLLVLAGPVGHEMQAAVTIAERRRGRVTSLGSFLLDETGIAAARRALAGRAARAPVLGLTGPACLAREVELPLAAERDAATALRYEMDSLTPFGAEDVFWHWTPTRRDRADGKLVLRLTVLPRVWVEPLLAKLAPLGVVPTALEAALPGGGTCRIPLGPAPRAGAAHRAAVVACAVLAAALAATPLVRQTLALRAAEARVAALQPRVTEAEALRRRIQAGALGAEAIAHAGARAGDALAALARLTERLPDDTFLTSLSLQQRHLSLEGQSAAATKLLAALAADPAVRNPAFAAPILRTEQQADLFTIQADLAP